MRRSKLELQEQDGPSGKENYMGTWARRVWERVPTVLRDTYLNWIYREISFASGFLEHSPWLTSTHDGLIETSWKIYSSTGQQLNFLMSFPCSSLITSTIYPITSECMPKITTGIGQMFFLHQQSYLYLHCRNFKIRLYKSILVNSSLWIWDHCLLSCVPLNSWEKK